jgi:hypothetical protein
MDWGLSNMIYYKRVRFSVLEESLDHEGIASQDSLVKSEFAARIDLGLSLLEDHIHNRVVVVI